MVGPSKILTVSYGTFSCTLEGFDDPFSTMKAIAEYFRDLAAEDRYFGAEPPTPDAEMLHRIAEREIQRRVEAKIQENGVILRASETVAGAGAQSRAIAAPVAAAAAPAEPAPPAAAQEQAPAGEDAARPDTEAPEEQAVATASPPDPSDGTDATDPALTSPEAAEAPVTGASAVAADADLPESAAPAAEATPETAAELSQTAREQAEAEVPEAPSEAEAPLAPAAEAPALDEPEAEDLQPLSDHGAAARLARIREAVARARQGAAPAVEAPPALPIAEVHAAAAPVPEPVAEIAAEPQPLDDAPMAEPAEHLEDQPQTDAPDLAAEAAAAPADRYADAADFADDADVEARVSAALGDTGLPPAAQADLVRELAEVERDAARERRNALLLQGGGDAAVARLLRQAETELAGDGMRQRQSTLSHLRAAVVAHKADEELGIAPPSGQAPADVARYREDLARAMRPEAANDLRLPRRPAQPVAASVTPGRPLRPEASGARTERPRNDRLAPLVLVSEQRVDRPRDAGHPDPEAIRPRRVLRPDPAAAQPPASTTDAPTTDAPGAADAPAFSAFAARVGASGMDDLMEAAAAYAAIVERRERFSRPQIVQLMAEAHGYHRPNREAELQVFGRMLRDGVILRSSQRGLFELSAASRYASAARRFVA